MQRANSFTIILIYSKIAILWISYHQNKKYQRTQSKHPISRFPELTRLPACHRWKARYDFWALADTGSWRDLLSEKFYKSLPLQVPVSPPGSTVVVDGNGKALHLRGWGTFKFEIDRKNFFHEVGVVRNLTVDFLIGGEVMRLHAANLQFASKGRNSITFL